MLINKLKLKNFKQYKDEIINFPTGLTGLVGRNGAGKSTVFDAISFALFGPLKGVNLSQLLPNLWKLNLSLSKEIKNML